MNQKLIVGLIAVLFMSVSAAAQNSYMAQPGSASLFKTSHKTSPEKYTSNPYGIEVSAQLGFSIPTSKTDEFYGYDVNKKWGETGISYGLQALYSLTSHFSLGLEFNALDFGAKDIEIRGVEIKDVKVREQLYMLASRIYFNHTKQIRAYIPLGIGLAHIEGSISPINKLKAHDNSLALYAGLGVETNLDEHTVVGLEGRFNHAEWDKEHIEANIQHFNVLARIGYKF